jgi:hypothetical protein
VSSSFLRRFGSGGQLGVFFSARYGGSFAALLLHFALSARRSAPTVARRFSELFLRRFGGALSSAFCFRRALIVLSVLF